MNKAILSILHSVLQILCNNSQNGTERLLFSGRKFMQPILKYLLMVATQYNSIGLINTHYHCDYKRVHAGHTSCSNLLAPVRHLSSNSGSSRISFSQEQRVFIFEHYLSSRSYFTCQNEFRDTFPDSPVPNKSTISHLVNRFRHCRIIQLVASNTRKKSECMNR
jgi:hypothetical protein